MRVEIRNLIKDAQGDRVGYLDIRIIDIGLEIFGCQVHELKGRRWIKLPSKIYKKPGGHVGRNYFAKFFVSADYEAFCDAVFAELDRQFEKGPQVNALVEITK